MRYRNATPVENSMLLFLIGGMEGMPRRTDSDYIKYRDIQPEQLKVLLASLQLVAGGCNDDSWNYPIDGITRDLDEDYSAGCESENLTFTAYAALRVILVSVCINRLALLSSSFGVAVAIGISTALCAGMGNAVKDRDVPNQVSGCRVDIPSLNAGSTNGLSSLPGGHHGLGNAQGA